MTNSDRHPDDNQCELTPIVRTKIELAVKRYQAARTAYYESRGDESERRVFRAAAEDLERAEWVEALALRVTALEKFGASLTYVEEIVEFSTADFEHLRKVLLDQREKRLDALKNERGLSG